MRPTPPTSPSPEDIAEATASVNATPDWMATCLGDPLVRIEARARDIMMTRYCNTPEYRAFYQATLDADKAQRERQSEQAKYATSVRTAREWAKEYQAVEAGADPEALRAAKKQQRKHRIKK